MIIKKTANKVVEYIQELAVRYLSPPTPPPPGEIIIIQESNKMTLPAPPLIIRQQPARPLTPAPLIIREAPPVPREPIGIKKITISGKKLPPPPRKVIIERLAPLPSKPQAVIIERWLPYQQAKRRVIFKKSILKDPEMIVPKNVIIQWEAPAVSVKQQITYLGVVKANPAEYIEKYKNLYQSVDLPAFVNNIKTPENLKLSADVDSNATVELEGDLDALNLIDLDKEGLSEYKHLLNNKSDSSNTKLSNEDNEDSFISQVFALINVNREISEKITRHETEKILLKLNSRLDKNYGENEVNQFMEALDKNGDGLIDIEEFKEAFKNMKKF